MALTRVWHFLPAESPPFGHCKIFLVEVATAEARQQGAGVRRSKWHHLGQARRDFGEWSKEVEYGAVPWWHKIKSKSKLSPCGICRNCLDVVAIANDAHMPGGKVRAIDQNAADMK